MEQLDVPTASAPLPLPYLAEPAACPTFEQAAMGIIHIGLDGRILRVNRKLCEMHGYRRDELVGRPAGGLSADGGAEGTRAAQALLQGRGNAYTAERRFIRKDGHEYPARVSVSLARAADVPYFISFVEDLTQQHDAECEILRLNQELEVRIRERTAQLEERNEELRMFAYSLAHDLRAPLAALDGYSHHLERHLGPQVDDKARHYLARVRHSAHQMSELTDAMLALARLTQDGLDATAMRLEPLAHAWHERMAEEQPGRGVEFAVHPLPAVRADRRLVIDLLENLLGNAWKFTGRTDAARIELGGQLVPDAEGWAEFYVRDNGAGFDAQYAHKLFQPFHRLHSMDEFTGHGMGLAIVRKIVQRHGGQVWAEGAPGQGATFRFTLPTTAASLSFQ